jgi:hypothetical protein
MFQDWLATYINSLYKISPLSYFLKNKYFIRFFLISWANLSFRYNLLI